MTVRVSPAPMLVGAAAAVTSRVSDRLTALPPYVFAWLDDLKAQARARGQELIDLGIGSPDQPTPPVIVEALGRAFADERNQGYPPFRGTSAFRNAVASFFAERFGVAIDPETEVLAVSGGKEGIAHLTIAFAGGGGLTLVPDVHYPVHARATGLFGGEVHHLPVHASGGYLPRFGDIPIQIARRARMLVINYPHNPTGAVAPLAFFEEAVAFCRAYGIVLVSDLAYSEITFDGVTAPSVFQVEGAREVAVEFHSFSKTFNMAGARIGFAVGAPHLIDVLHAVRTNMGYGSPAAVQQGAAVALANRAALTPPVVARYRARRNAVVDGFRRLGWDVPVPHATMFVWLRVPQGYTSSQWTEHLIERTGVVVTPGNAFGPGGEGYFRISLVRDADVLRTTLTRLGEAGIRFA